MGVGTQVSAASPGNGAQTGAVSGRSMDDAWGDARVAALADVLLALTVEVFELRNRLSVISTTGFASRSSEALDADAEAFVERVFAPFTAGSRAVSA